ncbi:hypothetical protein [Thermoactinomyces sp. Gus2-1]|jgi:predicted SprT family Zn-dependent metalloprotease|uniref:hypothetical protein n=1 Tax=Thermoactinomyces sp. Gus2-1 TaxID=1535750 RepID=UPI0008411F0E|nr:hypothetical protein [Thermoactinomyces sp. Gus2-1]
MSLPEGFIQIDLFSGKPEDPVLEPVIKDPVTLDELYKKANEFCQEYWGVEFTGKIEISNVKWRRRLACFSPEHELIRFSRARNMTRTREQIYDTLLHELVHWRLFRLGLPYDDTAFEFIRECKRVGASLSGAKKAQEAARRYDEKPKHSPRKQKGVVYRCKCGKSIEIDIPAVVVICGCGRRMEREEEK